ncbi:hypothetical protein KVV02_004018, partial [Mortierella alpina]
SALDSDEEEEWFRNYDKEQRKAQRAAHGTNGSNCWSAVAHVIANGLQQTLPSDAIISPTFQYGRRTRLYHPKLERARDQEKSLDQQKASTSNGAADKDKAKEADKDENNKLSPVTKAPPMISRGAAPSATTTSPTTPSLVGNATPAVVSIGASKPAAVGESGWAAAGFKKPDTSNKWKCPACYVWNYNTAPRCPCCITAKPGGTVSGSTPATTSMFDSSAFMRVARMVRTWSNNANPAQPSRV